MDNKGKKKICFITTIPGTIESFVLNTAVFLHENTDWDISFICDKDEDFAKSLPSFIHYFPISMERGISLGGIKAFLEMKKIFKKEKFYLIQYSTPNASLYASMAGKLAKVPVRLYCQWGMAFVGMSGIKRTIFKTIEKFICSLSTWIEPDSKSNLDFAHSEGLYKNEKGSVIGSGSACGVQFSKFNIDKKDEFREKIREQHNIPEDAFVFGFVGRITRDKGIDELLAATRKFMDNYSNVYFLNLGSEEGLDTLDKELYEWSLTKKNIIYTGNVNNVEQYLSAMDCYVLPSYREGFGMGVVEAEAMGVPVIVTDIPGPIDAIKPNVTGKTVIKKDVESLYNAMNDIYSMSENERNAMGQNGRAFVVENFEQEKLFELILDDRIRLMTK